MAAVVMEHERLWRRENESIPSFIPIHAREKYSPAESPQQSPLVITSIPLDVRPPAPLPALTYEPDWRQELKKEIQTAQQGFQKQF